MVRERPSPDPRDQSGQGAATTKDVELLRVMVVREGKQVNAQWAIHPQLKHDLNEDEWKEVSELMAQISGIVGGRFAELLAEAEPDQPGHA